LRSAAEYFQETHPEHLFAQCRPLLRAVSHPEQMPRVLEIAMQTAVSRRGVSVVILPGDVALQDAVEAPRLRFPTNALVCPSDEESRAREAAGMAQDGSRSYEAPGAPAAMPS